MRWFALTLLALLAFANSFKASLVDTSTVEYVAYWAATSIYMASLLVLLGLSDRRER